MIRILLVDDHKMVREGLKAYLKGEPDMTVIGEAGDGRAAATFAAEYLPDVILMDIMMPIADGIEGSCLCLAASPQSKILVLTSAPDDDHVIPAIKAGALSYLLKDISASDLAKAIRNAAAGKATLHPMAAARMMQEVHSPRQSAGREESISPREREVLALIAQGMSNKDIGEKLFIGERTVKTHVSHLLGKLQLEDRTQLAIYAVRNKLT